MQMRICIVKLGVVVSIFGLNKLTPMLKLPKKRNKKKNHLLDIDLNALIRKMRKIPTFKDTNFLCE